MNGETSLDCVPGPTPIPRIPDDITVEKRSRREEIIAKMQTLLEESFKNCTANQGRGGTKNRQKWFSISASLAQSLARLVSELEYEKLRLELDAMKKRMQEQNVTRSRVSFPQIVNGMDQQSTSKRSPTSNSDRPG